MTVFADLTVAVGVGMVLAALLFIQRVADTTTVTAVTDDYVREGQAHILQGKTIPPYVKIFRIHGPFLFGATDKLRPILNEIDRLPAVVDPAAAQHDGARRHRPQGFRGTGGRACDSQAGTCCSAAPAISPRT